MPGFFFFFKQLLTDGFEFGSKRLIDGGFGGNAGAAAARLICRNTDTARVEVGAGACMHKHRKTDKSEVVHSGGLLWFGLNNAACC